MKLIKYNNYNGGFDNNFDVSLIQDLFTKTFTDSEGESEGKLIGDLVFKLITETDPKGLRVFAIISEQDKILGSVIFSKMEFQNIKNNEFKSFLLSPMAVSTSYQKQGLGKKLLNFAHQELKKEDAEFLFTYGDINFYSKAGYKQITEDLVKAPLKLSYPEGWLALSLTDENIPIIEGNSSCVEALNDPVYW